MLGTRPDEKFEENSEVTYTLRTLWYKGKEFNAYCEVNGTFLGVSCILKISYTF